jgi:RNA polymerase sigma-54 factor
LRREHARLVGRIIFCNLLEYPLKRYKRMIEEVEASPLMGKVPMTVKHLSQMHSCCPGEKGSPRVIAEIAKNGQVLTMRYAEEGFNKIYMECPCSMRERSGEINQLLYKLRRISSRNELTYQVLKGIIEQQGEYLRTGNPLNMVPLTQVELAKAISSENRKIHHSWISRLIGGLTVLTPFGEEKALKFFFPSKKQVTKFFIKDLLDREREDIVSNKIERPYTDEHIRDMLPSSLSHWSVAQCRKEMGIPPSKRRFSYYRYPPLTANFSMLYPLTVEAVQSNAPASPGIYEFRLKGKEIEYPHGKTPIIYIGSTRNIKKRLRDHIGKNSKNGRIRDFLKNNECSFRYIELSTPHFQKNMKWREEEKRLYKLFVTTYGSAPKCNKVKPWITRF